MTKFERLALAGLSTILSALATIFEFQLFPPSREDIAKARDGSIEMADRLSEYARGEEE